MDPESWIQALVLLTRLNRKTWYYNAIGTSNGLKRLIDALHCIHIYVVAWTGIHVSFLAMLSRCSLATILKLRKQCVISSKSYCIWLSSSYHVVARF